MLLRLSALRYIHRVWIGFHILKIIEENSGINKMKGFFHFYSEQHWGEYWNFFIHRHRNKVVSQYWCKFSAVVYLFTFQNRDYKQQVWIFKPPFWIKTFISAMTSIDIPIIPTMLDSALKEAFACCKGIVFIKEAGEQQLQHGRSDVNRIDVC